MQEMIQIGDYLGTFVFGVTGALAAAEKRLDLGGFCLLAFVTGVGGGTTRDLILDRGGVFWADRPLYIVLCIAAAVLIFFAGGRLHRLRRALVWADAVGVALFAVIGAGIAVQEGARPLVAVLMGALTAAGGGVIRDMIRNELPLVLHREIYATAAVAGASTLVALHLLETPAWASVGGGIAIAFALRAWGIVSDVHLPVYTPASAPGAIEAGGSEPGTPPGGLG